MPSGRPSSRLKQTNGQGRPERRAGPSNGLPRIPEGISTYDSAQLLRQQPWSAMVPAKTHPRCRGICLFTLSDIRAAACTSTYLYNKAHLMSVRFRILDDTQHQHALRYIAWPSCGLRFFEADRRKQASRVRVHSGGVLTPIEQATRWDPLVPEGPDQERHASRLAEEVERKGMRDLAALIRRQYMQQSHPAPDGAASSRT